VKKIVYLIITMLVVSLAIWVNADEGQVNIGKEIIVIEKGRMPQVTFPHRMHQQKLNNDCALCHDLFPMQAGIIKTMVTQEKLRDQQVMNSKCLKCHKERKNEGLAAGPTKCTECHVRPK
jgi:hypothetical protein